MVHVAIGLGSNLGDRNANLQQAVEALSPFIDNITQASLHETPALLPEDAPAEWDKPFLNTAVIGETNLAASELLQKLQQIEQELGRKKAGRWSPRIIDLDILLYGEEVIEQQNLQVPHPQMLKRDFVMQPLKEIAGDWQHPVAGKQIRALGRTQLMGIVNVTPDSFSDGGQAFEPQAAIDHARQLLADGADVLDIGAESTRPQAEPVTSQREWQRLQPVLEGLQDYAAQISVDTRHAQTVQKALALGVGWINDVSAAGNPALIEAVVAHPSARYVLMHSLSVPADPQMVLPEDVDVVSEIMAFAKTKLAELETQGIDRNRIIFDPGLGFGKTAQQSLELIERITEFKMLGVPLLVGHSRKSFLKLFTAAPAGERDALTLEFSKKLALAGVGYLRVHNIRLHHGL